MRQKRKHKTSLFVQFRETTVPGLFGEDVFLRQEMKIGFGE